MTVRRFASIAACAAAVVLASSSGVRAESYAGFRGGINYAKFTTNDVYYSEITDVDSISGLATDRRLGFSGGAFIGTDYGKGLGFRLDLMYVQKGGTDNDTTAVDLDYLELGTLFVYRYKLSERYTLRAFVGPVVGLWVNAELDLGPYDKDLGEVIDHWEFSGTIGAELDMTAGPYVLLIEARFTRGDPVFKNAGLEGQPININARNSGISVMTGVAVPF